MVTLNGFEDYLKQSGLSGSLQRCYYDIVKVMSHDGLGMNDLLDALYRVIKSYSKGGHLFNTEKSMALLRLASYYIEVENQSGSTYVDNIIREYNELINQIINNINC